MDYALPTSNFASWFSHLREKPAVASKTGQIPNMDAIIDRLLRPPGGAESVPEVRAYSERVQQELRSLRENRDQLLSIIDLIPVAFFVKDHQSCFFLMNRACELQWGLSFADLRDTDGSQFFPPDQMDQFLAKDRSIFESRQPVEFEETSGAPPIIAIGSVILSSDPCMMRMAILSISSA